MVRNPSVLVYMYVYLCGLDLSAALKVSTRKPINNSDRKEKSDFKSGMSSDRIIYKAKGPTCLCPPDQIDDFPEINTKNQNAKDGRPDVVRFYIVFP